MDRSRRAAADGRLAELDAGVVQDFAQLRQRGFQRFAYFRLSGDDVLVTPEAYTILALVVHELATGHDPMVSAPAELARLLAQAAAPTLWFTSDV